MCRSSRAGEVDRWERRVDSRASGWIVDPEVVVEAEVVECAAEVVDCVEEGIAMV